MSQLEKLAILGIRSFDNIKSETIHFHTPLTLIVGLNGSGKTTIIECLKYATTGELPPNSRGGAFIHDPSICAERVVMGQVKVMFKSTSQAKMVLSRSMELTVKKATRAFKTLDGSLLMMKNGERLTVTSRVAELDKLMPQNLGVSKAILEYVIFCHQDESLWPLSEPAPLKKKFDEIFEAEKYTKAIDKIKKIRKAKGDKLKELKIIETQAKDTKIKAHRAEKSAQALGDELETLREEIRESGRKSKEAESKAKDAWDQAFKYKSVLDALDLRRKERSFVQSTIHKLKPNLKERGESDDWLRSELENYEQRAKSREEQQAQLKKQYSNLSDTLKQTQEQERQKNAEKGGHERGEKTHQEQLERRKAMIREDSRSYNIRGFEGALNDAKVNEFMDRVRKLSKERQTLVEKARKDTDSDMRRAQETLSKLSEQRSTAAAEQRSSKQQIASNDQKIKVYRSEMASMSTDEGELDILRSKIEGLDETLRTARKDARAATWDQKIQAHDFRLRDLKDKIKALNDELIGSTKHAGELAQQAHLHKELTERQKNLDKMKNVHKGKLKTLLNHEWDPSILENDLEDALKEQTRSISNAERQRTSISSELEQMDAELTRIQKSLADGNREANTCEQRLRNVLEGEPDAYQTEITAAEQGRDVLKSDVEGHGYVKDYYQKAIDMAVEKHKCKLCTRNFDDDKQTQGFIDFMKKKVSKDGQLKELKQSLVDQESLLYKIRDAGPAYQTWARLTKSELPKLQTSESDLASRRITVIRKLEDQDRVVNDLEQVKAEIDSLAKPVANVTKYHEEIASLSAQLSEIEHKQQDADFARTLEEIREELDATNEEFTGEMKSKDKLATVRDESRIKINSKELELRETKNKLEKVEFGIKEKESKAKQVEELNDASQLQRDRIRELDVKLQELAPQIETAQSQLEDIKSRGNQEEKSLRDKAARLSQSLYQLEQVEKDIGKYIEAGGSANLERSERELSNLKVELKRIEEERNDVVQRVNKVTEELRGQEESKRIIRDNLDYRSSLRELEALQMEIADLEAQNVEADRDHWQAEATRWQNQHNVHQTATTEKLGMARAKDTTLAGLLKDYDTDFKDAAQRYKKAHIDVETTIAAIKDLGIYASALDKAIMKYHSIKMEEINRIVDELWKKTYQGTDVDTIMIRSDNEQAKGNQAYNYRVCMVKQDAEMDMRGRCSAGQKVLASIIIRLALAECFGVNCGLIALDEPTTNLDQDNIRALAKSLHELIQTRRHQANFQLIIITHDEEFLKHMQCPDFCEAYYRVSRDAREKSVITKQSISEVM